MMWLSSSSTEYDIWTEQTPTSFGGDEPNYPENSWGLVSNFAFSRGVVLFTVLAPAFLAFSRCLFLCLAFLHVYFFVREPVQTRARAPPHKGMIKLLWGFCSV